MFLVAEAVYLVGVLLHLYFMFRFDVRENFVTEGVVESCNRLPRAVVVSPSLEAFKQSIDMVFREWLQTERG